MYLLAVTAANHPFHKISPPPDGRGHTLLYCFSHLPKPQRRGFAGFGTLCRHNLQRLPGFIGPVPPPLLMRTQFQFNRPALICQTWTGRLLHLFPGVGGHDILRKLADSLPDRVLPHPGYLRITGGRQIPGSGPAVRGPPLPWVAEDLLALAGGLALHPQAVDHVARPGVHDPSSEAHHHLGVFHIFILVELVAPLIYHLAPRWIGRSLGHRLEVAGYFTHHQGIYPEHLPQPDGLVGIG